ncbi:hypothetical protein dsx2_3112 [Desulfovibrio sp. X2]|uniref:hypothetical protein n=1 Tax=Desulfovibrio sp. X2 TaxID=941449 RepID=UPI00035882A5|nr:hypothetical protein [Desulfovibrio sp. X2]EPR41593.1 hypothetical protein dsx2_3112 [Desulfovibrio sp. X2]
MRIKTIIASLAVAAVLTLWAGLAMAAEVAQGKCVSYNQDAKVIVIDEYDTNPTKQAPYGQPTGVQSTFDVSGAKIGIKPEPGDVLRIAFASEGSARKASKVMNVSKQDLRKK